jgi:hypothetical protein
VGRILSPCRRQRARPVGLGGVGDQAELPAIFPLDVDAGSVSKRELARRLDPHVDAALAKLFVRGRPSIAASGLNLRITVSGMFEPLNHDRLIRSKHRLAAATRVALKKPRRQHTDDPGFQRLVRATRKPGARAATDTDAVTRSLAATFFPDLRREITLNDASMPATFSGRGDGIKRFLAHLASG